MTTYNNPFFKPTEEYKRDFYPLKHTLHQAGYYLSVMTGATPEVATNWLRNKIKKAGFDDVSVTNKAIANLDGSEDLVITQQQLTDRARQQTPGAMHVSVDNFMNSPKYDEVVDMVVDQHKNRG